LLENEHSRDGIDGEFSDGDGYDQVG
jgi:hypothetical protein